MLDWNQAKGLASASRFVTVGDRRASIGEPMKVIDAGRFGSFSAAMTAAAASTGGPGWQTPTTWARGPIWASISRTWSMKS